jgi:hypothetical protein
MRRGMIIGIVIIAVALLIYFVIRAPTVESTAQAAEELSQSFGLQGAALACAKWIADSDGTGGSADLINDAARASELAAQYNSRWTHLNDDIALYAEFPDGGLGVAITAACRAVPSQAEAKDGA